MKNNKPGSSKCKSAFLIAISMVLFSLSAVSQDVLSLYKIVNGATPAPYRTPEQSVKPTFFEATANGGKIEASVNFKNGNQFCTARFRYEWQFSASVNQLTKNQTVNIEYKTTLLSAPCPAAKGQVLVSASSGLSPEFKNLGIRYAGGLEIKQPLWATAGDNAPAQAKTSTLKVINASVSDAVFRIVFETQGYTGSDMLHYEVVYVFKKGAAKAVNCDPDIICHNLYSVGVAIGFAEYGALMNARTSAVAGNLEIAIGHAKASKCVPTDKLSILLGKIKTAAASKTYYNEISALRQELAVYVGKNCNCCQ